MPNKKDKEEITEETQNLVTFMQTLLDAGMAPDSVINRGFEWAGNVSLGTHRYDYAAKELLLATDYLKISRKFQEAKG